MTRSITNCCTRAAMLSAIAFSFQRFTKSYFIVSSFSDTTRKVLFHEDYLNAIVCKLQNLKSRFAIMLSRSMLTGLFETD